MGLTPILRVMPRRVVDVTDERMRLLAEAYARGEFSLEQLEEYAAQVARGEQPEQGGFNAGLPVIADPDLYHYG